MATCPDLLEGHIARAPLAEEPEPLGRSLVHVKGQLHLRPKIRDARLRCPWLLATYLRLPGRMSSFMAGWLGDLNVKPRV